MDDELIELSDDELLVFAGLARALIQLDGRFSREEAACLHELAQQLAGPRTPEGEAGPYRGASPRQPLGADALFALLERAGETLYGAGALEAAARAVTHEEARAHIHAMLHALACADTATPSELALLDWLASEWKL